MSEPKTVAKSFDEVVPGLHHYQIQDERINHTSDAFALVDGGKVVLIDPLPIEAAALERLGPIAAIVIGSPSHQRSAWTYRKETKVKVWAPAGAKGIDERPDETFKEGDRLPGGLRALQAPGPKRPHFAFHLDRGPGVLLCGDLLMNEPGKGVIFLPEKYMEEPARAAEGARRLLDRKFDVLCFGHGAPITKGGRKALEALLRQAKA